MISKEGFSLIIPARNCEKFIKNSLNEYDSIFSKKFKNFEIIIVFNDTSDNSIEICKKIEKKIPLKIINISQRGKGYALIKGFQEAKFDIMGFIDADNPFDLDRIFWMITNLDFYDVVIASKYKKGRARIQDSLLRRIISILGGFVSRFLFNLTFADTQAGAKFFKKEVWEKVRNNLICTGFDWDIEFLYKAKKNNFNIAEIYIPFKYEKFSTFRLKYLPGILGRLFKLRFLN